ncbi:shematrin-like protein 2 [Episyrphus balteatus]|uniref:shematrin-like protein 2 n=1 Tax=Episyrphus balteatus TaxID=286459 RepID=UPI002486A087|nr:shematrin-like protein 2 [Episyrphus balteatus]
MSSFAIPSVAIVALLVILQNGGQVLGAAYPCHTGNCGGVAPAVQTGGYAGSYANAQPGNAQASSYAGSYGVAQPVAVGAVPVPVPVPGPAVPVPVPAVPTGALGGLGSLGGLLGGGLPLGGLGGGLGGLGGGLGGLGSGLGGLGGGLGGLGSLGFGQSGSEDVAINGDGNVFKKLLELIANINIPISIL